MVHGVRSTTAEAKADAASLFTDDIVPAESLVLSETMPKYDPPKEMRLAVDVS
jgi:hypothetical protein